MEGFLFFCNFAAENEKDRPSTQDNCPSAAIGIRTDAAVGVASPPRCTDRCGEYLRAV